MHDRFVDIPYEWTESDREDADLIACGLEKHVTGYPHLLLETYDVIFSRRFNKRTVKTGKKFRFIIQSKFRD